MLKQGKRVLFYNAIPMPHSVKMHQLLVEAGYQVEFWYYKDLTTLYPWNSLKSQHKYFVFGITDNNLIKLLKHAFSADLVIITGWHTRIHVILSFFCYLLNIKYAYWVDVPEKPKVGFSTRIKRLLLKMTDYLLVTGKEGINRISIWYNLDYKKFRDFPYLAADTNEVIISEFNKDRIFKLANGSKINVLISNRFERRKGYECVYQALKITDINLMNNFCFTIIGSGSELDLYKKLFHELQIDVNFKDWVEYEEYLKLIMECDILLHASINEPFGIPPIDAMAHGKLVIASDGVMSTYDRISDGKDGFLFESGDFEKLSKILCFLAKNSHIIYDCGAKAAFKSKKYSYKYNLDVIDSLLIN